MKKKRAMSTAFLQIVIACSLVFPTGGIGAEPLKGADNFTDLNELDANTKSKFDAMITSGHFDGLENGKFGPKESMTRAQFAKSAVSVFKLSVDNSISKSSFSDVSATDPANGYALPYIEAIVKAGITNGMSEGIFNPSGIVTKEQLAVFLVRALGLEKEVKPDLLTDTSVSIWASGYVALVIEKKLLPLQTDGTFGGTLPATREQLLVSLYEAQQIQKNTFNGKYGIKSLTATDVNALTVELNAPVSDTNTVKFDVTRDNMQLNDDGIELKWNDDKTKVILSFNQNFTDSEWRVTLRGIKEIDEALQSSKVVTKREQITKIEFVNPGSMIPLLSEGKKVQIDFKAFNQYGLQSKRNTAQFTINVSSNSYSLVSGQQALNLHYYAGMQRNDKISVTILSMEEGIVANKTFTIGDHLMISALEAAELKNASGMKIDSISSNSVGYLEINATDQYGNRVLDKDLLNNGTRIVIPDNDLKWGDNNANGFFDLEGIPVLKLTSNATQLKKIMVTIFSNTTGASVTKVVELKATGYPASIEFGQYAHTLAQGDVVQYNDEFDSKMFVPIVLKDADGNTLSADDLINKAEKLTIIATGSLTLEGDSRLAKNYIATSGVNKGKIAIKSAGSRGPARLLIFLKENPTIKAEMTLNIQEPRKASTIKFSTKPMNTMGPNWGNELKLKVMDQYGEELNVDANNDYYVRLSFKNNYGNAFGGFLGSKEIDQTAVVNEPYGYRKYVLQSFPKGMGQESGPIGTVSNQVYADFNVDTIYDKTFRYYMGQAGDSRFTLEASLHKKNGNSEVYKLTHVLETFDPQNYKQGLIYSVMGLPASKEILAVKDYLGDTVTSATYVIDNYLKFARELNVFPLKADNYELISTNYWTVESASSTNPAIAQAVKSTVDGKWYIVGLKNGTAKISIIYKDIKGNSNFASIDVVTKSEAPSISTLSLKRSRALDVEMSDLITGKYLWDAKLAGKITVKDQYDDEIVSENAPGELNEELDASDNWLIKDKTKSDITINPVTGSKGITSQNSNDLLNLIFTIDNVTFKDGSSVGANSDQVIIDHKTGYIQYVNKGGSAIASFRVNVVAPNGKNASLDVVLK
jgi:trimeric autotransporter adhesin